MTIKERYGFDVDDCDENVKKAFKKEAKYIYSKIKDSGFVP